MKLLFSGALTLATIAPAAAQSGEPVITAKLVTVPTRGESARAAAGDELFTYSRIYTTDGAVLEDRAKAGNWLLQDWYEVGTKLIPVSTKAKFKACVPATGTLDTYNGVCFLDDDGDGTFDRSAADFVSTATKLKSKARYSRVPVSVQRDDSFKFVLLYQGATADTLRFSYREFKNDMAREAFTEELTVPREPVPMMLRLKGRTFEIRAINGLGIEYRLID
ncbi:MAG: hypothetical protein ACREBO_07485 [Novosphingobium sp.]